MPRSPVKSKSRGRRLYPIVLLVALGALVACSDTSVPTEAERNVAGNVSFSIRLSKIAAASLVRAEVVITAADMEEMKQELSISGDTVTGTVRGIRAGNSRTFTLNGYDSSENLIYTGSKQVDMPAGETVLVRVTMRRISSSGTVLTQWPTGGHYYEVVVAQRTWAEANAEAAKRTYAGLAGHLATVQSAEENAYILNLVSLSGDITGVWLGGFQPEGSVEPSGGWRWVTKEPWAFTSWDPPNPNDAGGKENALLMLTGYPYNPGMWSDVFGGAIDVEAYVVEFEPAEGADLVVKGVIVHRVVISEEGEDWTEYGSIGEDARITGEIENIGDTEATNVSITVKLYNDSPALLGMVTNHSVGNIPAKRSVLFSVLMESVFPYSGAIGSPSAEVIFE